MYLKECFYKIDESERSRLGCLTSVILCTCLLYYTAQVVPAVVIYRFGSGTKQEVFFFVCESLSKLSAARVLLIQQEDSTSEYSPKFMNKNNQIYHIN